MDKQRLFYLLDQVNSGKATSEELAEYDAYLNRLTHHNEDWDEQGLGDESATREELRAMLNRALPQVVVPVRRLWPRIAAAASVLIALGAGLFYISHKKEVTQETAKVIKNDIAPGHNQATLTLANGKKIVLTKGLSGLLATQGKTAINASDNTIVYDATKADQIVSYNTLSTARGEQSPYPLVLPDGTKVWLNAESSITFPTVFTDKERIVKLTGEAYFEVRHDAKQPFKVQTKKQTIEDIGTAFDVNAYPDEKTTLTTLIEGSVKVGSLTLKPGQQTNGVRVDEVNARQFIAWKNGDFDFENDDIQTIMRQLQRWYNIDVTYESEPGDLGFYANISRKRNISIVLKALERTKHIYFKIEGRRIIVSKIPTKHGNPN